MTQLRQRSLSAQFTQALALLGLACEELGEVRTSGPQLVTLTRIRQNVSHAIDILVELGSERLKPSTRQRIEDQRG